MSPTTRGPSALAAETRMPATVGWNRALITLIGAALAAAGLAVVALGVGLLAPDQRRRPVIDTPVDDFVADHAWFWPVVAVAAAIVALLSLRWLLAQVTSNRVHSLALEEDDDQGRTRLRSDALTQALVREIEGYRGVDRAQAHLSGSSTEPRLTLQVALDGRADVAEVHRRVSDDAVAHARGALSVDALPTRLELRASRGPARDLR